MQDDDRISIDFTGTADSVFLETVESSMFTEGDASELYAVIRKKLRYVSFGDYLKRYIYERAGLTGPIDQVPLKEYQLIIRESFADNDTPQAFEETTAKLSALSKNWLTQQTVNRKIVFLLGFGLAMNADDVNMFLKKALRETGINAKNPFEVICWYCYKKGYSFLKFRKLWQRFCEAKPNEEEDDIFYNSTIDMRKEMLSIKNEKSLLEYVTRLKEKDNKSRLSVTAGKHFDRLYEEARQLVASIYNEVEEEKHRHEVGRYQSQLLNNERLLDASIQRRVERRRAKKKVYSSSDITETDLEHIISAAIPVDRHGNLAPGKASGLSAQFAGKRFNRQHISEIRAGNAEVTRFDLITLNFFIYSQKLDEFRDAKARYMAFIKSTNKILGECYLGELYISNPYECFVLMCMLSEEPLGTYADVWEMSYTE